MALVILHWNINGAWLQREINMKYLLILIGVIISIVSLVLLFKFIMGTKPIFFMNFSEGYKKFTISQAGKYSIWAINSKIKFSPIISPISKYNPVLINLNTNQSVNLTHLFMGLNVNTPTNKRQVYNFYAEAGEYILYLSTIYSYNNGNINLNSIDDKKAIKYNLEVSQQPSIKKFFLVVFSMMLGLLFFIFGLMAF